MTIRFHNQTFKKMKKLLTTLAITLSFFSITPNTFAQDSVTLYIELPVGPGRTITFMKDSFETYPTNISDDFFNTPMRSNYRVSDFEYALVIRLPKENNYFVFRVDNGYGTKAIIGCFCTGKDASFRLKSFDYVEEPEENSMEIFRKAKELEFQHKYRKANKLYQKAAEIGNVLAMTKLADNYRDGKGCIRNPRKAYHWYEQASFFGDKYSAAMIARDGYKHKVIVSVM